MFAFFYLSIGFVNNQLKDIYAIEDNYVKDMIERFIAKCRQSVTGRSRSIFAIFKDTCEDNLQRKTKRNFGYQRGLQVNLFE